MRNEKEGLRKSNVFFKQLVFERSNEPEIFGKVAYFQDKDDRKSLVITEWHRVLPGFRYSCKLEVPGSEQWDGTVVYNMVYCRMWVDDIQVVSGEGVVNVTLDNEVVPELSFGLGSSMDVDGMVKDLKEYFRERTFQLMNKEDIEKFISVYRTSCERVYSVISKQMKKGKPKLKGERIEL